MRFEITPTDGAVDDGLVIRLVEAEPGRRPTITATTEDRDGHRWLSSAQFLVADDGTVDLSRDAPARGAYFSMHPLSIITAMEPDDRQKASVFTTADAGPMVVRLHADDHHGATVDGTVTRHFQVEGVERRTVSDGTVHGTRFIPPSSSGGAVPAVVIVPGAVPAEHAALPMAALLARHGFTALVQECTDHPGLPDDLTEVPLELFRAGVQWLGAQPGVDAGRIGAIGLERGAEGLLAAAGHLPDLGVAAVVALSPSCVAWQGEADDTSAWTLAGEPLPYARIRVGFGRRLLRTLTRSDEPVAGLDARKGVIDDVDALRVAGLPVDAIAAPLCLLAGRDDPQWPAARMAELIYQARRAARRADADQKVVYAGLGHLIRHPYVPQGGDRYLEPEGGGLLLGGATAEGRHHEAAAWAKLLEFLARHLRHEIMPLPPLGGRPVDPEWPSGQPADEPGVDPEDELARAIVTGVDVDLGRGAALRNPLPAPPGGVALGAPPPPPSPEAEEAGRARFLVDAVDNALDPGPALANPITPPPAEVGGDGDEEPTPAS